MSKRFDSARKFESEKNGYKREQVDYYLKQLDDDFQEIIKNKESRLENFRTRIAALAANINEISQVVPQFKTENESLRERLNNIRELTNRASEARYLKNSDLEVVLANLITQILIESDNLDKLKPILPEVGGNKIIDGDDFFEILAGNKEVNLNDALAGFDFYDNNPLKAKAEKKLKKIEAKRNRHARK